MNLDMEIQIRLILLLSSNYCLFIEAASVALVTEVRHLVGYDAGNPFEHVAGSACCLDSSIEVADIKTCKLHCHQEKTCGSYLFAANERQCFLISEDSNFHPSDGPHGCERRCVAQELCEAFVFSPSSRLCFLIRFVAGGSTGEALEPSVRPNSDRVFGLVRDDSMGSLQASISRSLLRTRENRQFRLQELAEKHRNSATPEAASLAESNAVHTDARERQLHGFSAQLLIALLVTAGVLLLGLLALYRTAWRQREPALSVPRIQSTVRSSEAADPSASPVCKSWQDDAAEGASASTAPTESMAMEEEGANAALATTPSSKDSTSISESITPLVTIEKTQGASFGETLSPPKGSFKLGGLCVWREREMLVPVRRSVEFAGPTNYPVAGQVSSHVRSRPQQLVKASQS